MNNGILKKDDLLGKYRIEKEIGRGAVGVVYKAHDASIDRMVAIKTLLPELLQSDKKDELTLRFQQEARAAARCAHSNILTIYEFSEKEDIPFIAMEYVQGEELKKFLKDFIRFKIQDVVVITQQILAGLKFAHSKQVIHRDIKPANIILLKRKQIKITDFGIARIEDDSAEKLTESSAMVGTPNYMSPEQLNTQPLDNRTDLYSVGLILFELFSRAKTTKNRENKPRGYQLRDDIDLSKDWLKEFIPDEFVRVVYTALQKDLGQRYQNAAQFSAAILKGYKAYLIANEKIRNRQTAPSPIKDNTTTTPVTEVNSTSNHSSPPQSINWSPDILKKLELNLAQFIGPFAKVYVLQHSRLCRSIQKFIEALSNKIPDKKEKETFISIVTESCEGSIPDIVAASNEETSPTQTNAKEFDNSLLEDIEKKLAFFVGPIAKALVLKEINNSHSNSDLYRKLSSYIPIETERSAFLSGIGR
ncbi:Serine/threonine protein kinase [hydrothermal vent metagenome]|uniref:Serine/threonine protein kinase n=1 Tax=hydrothermal vent metagenome TaxID=652676 RepID=A0A3B0YUS3_9ZZZZ